MNFSEGKKQVGREHDPHRLKFPDGTWRLYMFEMGSNVMKSSSSKDGIYFSNDPGIRYRLQPADQGEVGIYELFIDSAGGIVMLYIGDLHGLNNIRRAYSPPVDKGMNFTFDRGDVLNDAKYGGGPNSYVDQKILKLSEKRFRLFVMKQGQIYSFISEDDGKTFILEKGTRLSVDDFTEFELGSLHDPWVVKLPDGRYRMYVAASVGKGPAGKDTKSVIVSATTPKDD